MTIHNFVCNYLILGLDSNEISVVFCYEKKPTTDVQENEIPNRSKSPIIITRSRKIEPRRPPGVKWVLQAAECGVSGDRYYCASVVTDLQAADTDPVRRPAPLNINQPYP